MLQEDHVTSAPSSSRVSKHRHNQCNQCFGSGSFFPDRTFFLRPDPDRPKIRIRSGKSETDASYLEGLWIQIQEEKIKEKKRKKLVEIVIILKN